MTSKFWRNLIETIVFRKNNTLHQDYVRSLINLNKTLLYF